MLPLSTLEEMLKENDPEYFGKIPSVKIRGTIINVLQLLPLPCRGDRVTPELCDLKDSLTAIEKGENQGSIKEVVGDFASKVKEVLGTDN